MYENELIDFFVSIELIDLLISHGADPNVKNGVKYAWEFAESQKGKFIN